MKAAQACGRVSLHGSDRFTILQINRWEDCISEILCGPNCDVVGVGEVGGLEECETSTMRPASQMLPSEWMRYFYNTDQ